MRDPLKMKLKLVNYVGIGVVTLLLAGATTFGVLPLFQKGKASITATKDLRETLSGFQGLREVLSQVEHERLVAESQLKEMESRLPSTIESSRFNAELTEVAKASGIRIESMPKPGESRELEGYMAMPMSIVGTGDWESCYKFLTGIRGMNRLTRLDFVALQVLADDNTLPPEKPLCQITVKFSIFYMER